VGRCAPRPGTFVPPGGARISDDATLWGALERFLLHHTRNLVVVDHEGRYQGTLTDRHLLFPGPLGERALQRLRVADLPCLTWPVLAPATSLTAIAQLLTECRSDAAPVLDDGHVLGVVTRAEVLAALADHGPLARPAAGTAVG
jgi:CBS domain-containing protein